MKKSLSIVLVLLFLLTACQVVPDDDQSLASTPISSSSITPPPSSSVVPTTQPTAAPTTQPTVPPYDICDGKLWYAGRRLYWRVKATAENIFIVDDARYCGQTDTQIFYFIESEPTKIYVVTIGDFTDHQVYYESTYGDINYMHIDRYADNYLQFVADTKRFFVFDMATGVTTLLMEQNYISFADVDSFNDDGTIGNLIWFEGKPVEEQYDFGIYYYNRVTGEYVPDNSL